MPIKRFLARLATVMVLATSAVGLNAAAAYATSPVDCNAYGDSVEIYVATGYPYKYCYRWSGSYNVGLSEVTKVKSGRYTLTYQYLCSGVWSQTTLKPDEYRYYDHCSNRGAYIPTIWIN